MYRPTTAIILDTRKPVKSQLNKYSVKLRVTYRNGDKFQQVYYPLKIYLGKKEFAQIRSSPKDENQRQLKAEMTMIEQKAWRIAGKVMNRQAFEAQYFLKGGNNLQGYFERAVSRLVMSDRLGTAESLNNAWASFKKFDNEYLLVSDITTDWLVRYEAWMVKEGKSITTIGMYLRALRTLLNELIRNGEMEADMYPFKGFTIKTERKVKVHLSKEEIDLLKNYRGSEIMAVSFWLFSYYCNGMNMNDILSLKWTDIKAGNLTYDRNKTRRTKKEIKKVIIPIKNVQWILDTYGNRNTEHIFPILEDAKDSTAKRDKLKLFLSWVNDRLEKVRQELSINTKITHAIARHSFANTIRKAGITTDFIQYALGHTSMDTTEHYLAGFEMDRINEASDLL